MAAPETSTFADRLGDAQSAAGSSLCVGLDPDPDRMPRSVAAGKSVADRIVAFNAAIVECTCDVACAYKVNAAFYERHGAEGWEALQRTADLLPPDRIRIVDAKRADIGNTADFYAAAFFEQLDFDACTVSPYMGVDSIEPFARRADKCAIVLCRTSNPGADDFQDDGGSDPLFLKVAKHAVKWNSEFPASVGLVVGATRIADITRVRAVAPSLPLLIPGVGAQGGDAGAAARAGSTAVGRVLVNASRSILYASRDGNFQHAARAAATELARLLMPA